VVLRVIVGTDGRVQRIDVVESLGYDLDENATAAIRTWEFAPATDDKGKPVESTIPVECNFWCSGQ
jgi:TonB family protein